MISKKEIFSKAKELNIPISTIEKDYVISWLLSGIFQYPAFQNTWIFKGGTCLKKCYFGNYRFSEDLDFTILDPSLLNVTNLCANFEDIADLIYDQSGIEIVKTSIRFESYLNLNQKISFQGKLNYRGPLQPKTNFPRLKIDLTSEEILTSRPATKMIIHDYSDELPIDQSLCYSFEEIFAEKLRALVERARPRDLYDVIHLHALKTSSKSRVQLLKSLREKCQYKNVPLPTEAILKNHSNYHNLESEWNKMLKHQLPKLQPFSEYWEKLINVLDELK